MNTNATTGTPSPNISRRTVARGLAWSAPVLTAVAAAPAFASSQIPPGLQGWVSVNKQCGLNGTRSITATFDGNGTRYPADIYGLYVHNTTSSSVITDASITFYLPSTISISSSGWTRIGSYQGWSTPVAIPVQDKTGFTGYITSYDSSYGWTYNAAFGTRPSFTIATGVPRFTANGTYASGQGSLCNGGGLRIWAKRCVTVNGNKICFERYIDL